MFLRGNIWHYDFLIGGERYRGSTGFKKNEKSKAKEAEDRIKRQARDGHSLEMIWEQTKRKMNTGKEIDIDFDTLWDTYTKRSESNANYKRVKMAANRLKHFCSWIKANYPEVKKISYIEQHHAQEWFNAVRQEDGANATKNDYLATLKMIFTTLGKESGIIESPFAHLRKLKNTSSSREAFTPEELTLIGKEATGWIYSLCLTALSTGLREGDICMLKKSSVNLETEWISIPQTRKTGVSVDIPILPGLLRHIKSQLEEENDSEFVFPELAEIYSTSTGKIGKDIKKFFERIGITETQKEVAGYKRKLSNKDVHSFRHTFVYLAACHGIPFPIVQGIVGHTSPEMTKHYMDHAGREAKAQYLHQLPDYLTGTCPQIEEKIKTLSPQRICKILERITPENFERNKRRFVTLLSKIN